MSICAQNESGRLQREVQLDCEPGDGSEELDALVDPCLIDRIERGVPIGELVGAGHLHEHVVTDVVDVDDRPATSKLDGGQRLDHALGDDLDLGRVVLKLNLLDGGDVDLLAWPDHQNFISTFEIDPAALTAAFARLIDNPALRQRLGEAGRVAAPLLGRPRHHGDGCRAPRPLDRG